MSPRHQVRWSCCADKAPLCPAADSPTSMHVHFQVSAARSDTSSSFVALIVRLHAALCLPVGARCCCVLQVSTRGCWTGTAMATATARVAARRTPLRALCACGSLSALRRTIGRPRSWWRWLTTSGASSWPTTRCCHRTSSRQQQQAVLRAGRTARMQTWVSERGPHVLRCLWCLHVHAVAERQAACVVAVRMGQAVW